MGDTKATSLKTIDTNRRVKNCYTCCLEPHNCQISSQSDYKKLLVNNIKINAVFIQTGIFRVVLFAGGGENVVLTKKLQKFSV